MSYLQQGDCLIKEMKGNIPEGAKPLDRIVLIEGEHTGHAHRVTEGEFAIMEHSNRLFLRCITKCLVTHEEHKKIVIPPGDYEIDQVREYDHLEKLQRKVLD